MPKVVPRRHRFAPPKRRRSFAAAPTLGAEIPHEPPPPPLAPAGKPRAATDLTKLPDLARLLWLPSYEELFDIEYEHSSTFFGKERQGLKPSTYRQRLAGSAAERYDRRRRQQHRDQMATELHANNMRHWTPSLMARSVSYFGSTTKWIRSVEGRSARLASDPITLGFLRMMRDCRCALSRVARACAGAVGARAAARACTRTPSPPLGSHGARAHALLQAQAGVGGR